MPPLDHDRSALSPRAACFSRHNFMFPSQESEVLSRHLSLSLAHPKQNAEKLTELFVYGVTCYIINLF